MITLRCTRKLLDRLGASASPPALDAPTNALGDWYANLIRVGRAQFVIATSERSLLTVVFPAREVRLRLVPALRENLAVLLRELDVPEEAIARELALMQPVAFAPTASRSVLASMNNLAMQCEWVMGGAFPLAEIMVRLSRTPMKALSDERGHYARPGETARRLLGLEARRPPPRRLVQLRVALVDPTPEIWRRIVVPEAIRLDDLHDVLQIAMGWTNSHLHDFVVGTLRYGMPDPEGIDPAPPLDEHAFRLGDVLAAHGTERLLYRYDFGDGWEHEVTVEKAFENDGTFRGPACIGGANACPPEDVGGSPGYLEFLHAIRDPAHHEHRAMLDWAGGEFDPAAFDRSRVDLLLQARFGH